MTATRAQLIFRYRLSMAIFISGLVVSGITAFPLVWELDLLCSWFGVNSDAEVESLSGMQHWLGFVRDGLHENAHRYPFVAYGTDWLAFAHLTIAVFFVGPLVQPDSHRWTLWSGVIACLGVIPLAHIAGPLREIPLGWRWIDCSFGILGAVPLVYCLTIQKRL